MGFSRTTARRLTSAAGLLLAAVFLYVFWPPRPPVASLRKRNPETTAMMDIRARQARRKGRPWRVSRQWVPLGQISPNLQRTVLAAEDDGFYRHGGVEWRCLKEALLYDLKRGRLARGGSTITQQLAKNLYLSPSKNPLRKVRELVLTYRLEKVLSKRRIFEVYLNVVEWGSGIFGAEAAARAYFGKPASELTLDESASLAAILPSPRRHDPRSGSRWVELRKQWVYRRMAESQRLPDLSAPSAEPEPPPPPPEEDEPETEEGEVAVESSTGPETAPASRNPAPPSPL